MFSLYRFAIPLDVPFHTGGAILFHLLTDMAVHVQSESGGSMAEVALHGFHIIPVLEGENGERMPLWHNKDKSENPCGATG